MWVRDTDTQVHWYPLIYKKKKNQKQQHIYIKSKITLKRLGMTKLSVGASFVFLILRRLFLSKSMSNCTRTHSLYFQSRFPWAKVLRFNAKKKKTKKKLQNIHNKIQKEIKDRVQNKNRSTQNPLFWDPLCFHRPYFPWETHSKHNINTSSCLCRCLCYLQREFHAKFGERPAISGCTAGPR